MGKLHYPQPHNPSMAFAFELDDATIDSTIIPILMYDEAQGNPEDLEVNPRNAAFAVTTKPNCYVNSRVDSINAMLKFALATQVLDDNITAVRIAYMVIKISFDDAIAIDELSSTEVQDVLEIQRESTDRQTFPLYTGAKILEKYTNSALLHADVPGLTASQKIEAVAFDPLAFYNALHYMTIANKLKTCQRGLKWITLTPNRPTVNVKIHIDNKVKAMNEYSAYMVLVHVPSVPSAFQIPITDDITAASPYVTVDWHSRWNEWNEDFNSRMI